MAASDQKLVHGALAGRAEAWERLVRRYEGTIYNIAYRSTGNREDALDLMQDVFVSVYRGLGTFDGAASFSTWLYAIASRRVVDHYRRGRHRPAECVLDDGVMAAGTPGPHALIEQAERRSRAIALLDCLPVEQRLVVELKYFQGQTFEEMSKVLGVSTNTLKTRFYAALKKIRALPEVACVVS